MSFSMRTTYKPSTTTDYARGGYQDIRFDTRTGSAKPILDQISVASEHPNFDWGPIAERALNKALPGEIDKNGWSWTAPEGAAWYILKEAEKDNPWTAQYLPSRAVLDKTGAATNEQWAQANKDDTNFLGSILKVGLPVAAAYFGGPLLAGALGGGLAGTAGAGALLGAGSNLITGGNPMQGALIGGLSAGAAGILGPKLGPIGTGATVGGGQAALTGRDPVRGAIGGATMGLSNAVMNAPTNSGGLVSDPYWGSSWAGSIDNPGALNAGGGMDLLDNFGGGAFGNGAGGGEYSLDPNWMDEIGNFGAGQSLPSGVTSILKSLPSGAQSIAQGALNALFGGNGANLSGAIDTLMKLGIPAALLAGLFEKNKGPLDDSLKQAANAAVQAAGAFADMPSLQQTDAQRRAIELGKSNVGNWKPYIDKADTLTADFSKGVSGVDLNKYMNPYLDEVLKNSIRDIEESAAKRNQELRAITSKSGNDFRSSVYGGNRFNVEDSLLDRERLRAVGDTSAKVRAGAFDTAWTNAARDVDRMGLAGQTYGTLGKTVGALGDSDVAGLMQVGALEQQPQKDALSKAASNVDVYRSIIPGTSQAAAATKEPSLLNNVVGALGVYTEGKNKGVF